MDREKELADFAKIKAASSDCQIGLVRKLDNINIEGEYSTTLLHLAAESSHDRLAKELIRLGIDCNAHDKNDHRPLDVAVYRGNFRAAVIIAEAGGVFGIYSETDGYLRRILEAVDKE